jgi:DNA-binding transcriptional regulator YiaG
VRGAAALYADWRNYFMVELPFHQSYFPDERERTAVQQAMTKWRKEMRTQLTRLSAHSRDSDPLMELFSAYGDSCSRPAAGQLYSVQGAGLQELAFPQLSEALEEHVRQLAGELESVNLREGMLIEIDYDLPAILRRAREKCGHSQEDAAEMMRVHTDTVKSWENLRRRPEDDYRKTVQDYVLAALIPE